MKNFCFFLLLFLVVFELTLPSVWAQKHGGPTGDPIIELGAATKPITFDEYLAFDRKLKPLIEQIQINLNRCVVVPEKNLETIIDLEKFLLKNAGTREVLLLKTELKKNCISCFQNGNVDQGKYDSPQCLFNSFQRLQFEVIIEDPIFARYLEKKYSLDQKASQETINYFQTYLKYIK
ncbi:MAG: hypothetical protein ACOYL6_14350 [Bacteriovoracaceae bacterium]